jgi:hypothetical protein
MNEHEKAICPCGSGKRYIECCLPSHIAKSQTNLARAFNEEMNEVIRGRAFDSIEAMNAFVQAYCDRTNAEPKADFLGLSADQVHRLIDFPLDRTADIVRLNDSFSRDDMAGIPVVENTTRFLRALAEVEPLKATATGNLPREFARRLFDKIDDFRWKKYIKFQSEEDSMTVHSLRLLLTKGGWVRKHKKHFRLTRKGRRSVDEGFSATDYLDLLRTFTREFNWGFQDRYPDFDIIQRGYLFALYIIHMKAGEFVEFYSLAPHFIRAFPLVFTEADELRDDLYREVSGCFTLRFLERFCAYFGLIETRGRTEDPVDRRFSFRASRFYDKLLVWKI